MSHEHHHDHSDANDYGMAYMTPGDSDSMRMGEGMTMTFFTSTSTALFSNRISAKNLEEYVGICMFLIILSVALRFLLSFKAFLEFKWKHAETEHGTSLLPTNTTENHKTALASKKSSSKALRNAWTNAHPWRWNVDLPRAGLSTVIVAVSYLLMLAVMTMNVGFVLSVLGGVFLGELLWGRFFTGGEH